MTINVSFLRDRIRVLEFALGDIDDIDEPTDIVHNVYCAACVREFERALVQSGSLLRRRLAIYHTSDRHVGHLAFRELFDQATRRGLIAPDATDRWLVYRDIADNARHMHDVGSVNTLLEKLPAFIKDGNALADILEDRAVQVTSGELRSNYLHLASRERRELERLCQTHLSHIDVWAYGSRVNGRSHAGSDLDLVLRQRSPDGVPRGHLGDFRKAVRACNMPFSVDIHDWADIPDWLRREIERRHVVLWRSRVAERVSEQ